MNDERTENTPFMEWSGDYFDTQGRAGWDWYEKLPTDIAVKHGHKIYAKILANRLKEYLVQYINEDLVGFLPKQHLKDNINAIEVCDKLPGKPLGLIFVDAEKTFGNLDWEL